MTTKGTRGGTDTVQFRVGLGPLADQLDARTRGDDARGATARTQLERYFDMLDLTLSDARRKLALTEGEASFLVDVANGTFWELFSARMIWAEVLDAPDSVAAEWGVDRDDLAARLRNLTTAERLAVVDAIERWWGMPDRDANDVPGSLRAVGLLDPA